jgi:hypothetical protein
MALWFIPPTVAPSGGYDFTPACGFNQSMRAQAEIGLHAAARLQARLALA